MRVWSRIRRDEKGASIVIIGVSLLAVFGAAVLSVDAGNMWQSRRNIITASDASAHQEARTAALLGGDQACQDGGAWEDILAENAGSDVNPIDCEVVPVGDDGAGYVVVEADQPVDFRFAPILGIGDSNAFSLSAAQHGFTDTIEEGLRPMAFCAQNSDVQEWIDGTGTGDPYHAANVYHLTWTKDNPDACGGDDTPGNWGWMDLDSGSNQNADNKTWVESGYGDENCSNGCSGEVKIGECDTGQSADQQDGCDGTTGARAANNDHDCGQQSTLGAALDCLIDSGEVFFVPVYESATGNGSTADFEVVQFLGVRLIDFCLTSNGKCEDGHGDPDHTDYPGGDSLEDYFDLEFVDAIVSGTCCLSAPPGGIDTGLQTITLCGVDHDPLGETALEERCAFDE